MGYALFGAFSDVPSYRKFIGVHHRQHFQIAAQFASAGYVPVVIRADQYTYFPLFGYPKQIVNIAFPICNNGYSGCLLEQFLALISCRYPFIGSFFFNR
jgi:hypothetical protein